MSEFVYNWTRSYLNATHPRGYFELGHLKRFIYADQYICLWFTPETDFSEPILTSTTETILATVHRILDTHLVSGRVIRSTCILKKPTL